MTKIAALTDLAPGQAEVVRAFESLALLVRSTPADSSADIELMVGTVPLLVEVKRLSVPTSLEQVLRHTTGNGNDRDGVVALLVAERIPATMQTELRGRGVGFLDLRGHLFLSAPGLHIDADVPCSAPLSAPRDLWGGRVGLEVASALLLEPMKRQGVRALARLLDRSPGTVSETLTRMRELGLVGRDNLPDVPELFWQAAEAWTPSATPLKSLPPRTGPISQALHVHATRPAMAGWALTDATAAAAYGAPVSLRADQPPDFLVPEAHVRNALQLLGSPALGAAPAATVRTSASPLALSHRVPGNGPWPLAAPVFVALDLAQDQGRGREILEQWVPPDPWPKVW